MRLFDFQQVTDLRDPFDPAKDFLGHLLLVERVDSPSQNHPPLMAFEKDPSTKHIGTVLNCGIDSVEQRAVGHGSRIDWRVAARQRCDERPTLAAFRGRDGW